MSMSSGHVWLRSLRTRFTSVTVPERPEIEQVDGYGAAGPFGMVIEPPHPGAGGGGGCGGGGGGGGGSSWHSSTWRSSMCQRETTDGSGDSTLTPMRNRNSVLWSHPVKL